MVTNPKRVLFLDGLGFNPSGFKPRFMSQLGYDVTAPMLSDQDFEAAVQDAERAMAACVPDVIVGYSRGGGIALRLADRQTPRILIAPALRYAADGCGCAGPVVILHSETDDSLPLDEVRGHMVRCGLPNTALRIVGDDHTMIDEPALAALTAALIEMTQ